ncbi:hypothetical protein J437_LFUL018483 [Ladona fulva]|uniref:Uncharacterized protein n=1 Tax=Ladona fulva TaxID=123851 RepID=A0A8K0JZR2_LADFU|nr:hypothetical protein J437_LFUL018483 [Ladona fulva]
MSVLYLQRRTMDIDDHRGEEAIRPMELTSVQPFKECITISGACLCAFRRNFLKKDEVGITPAGGYRWRDAQSYIAVMWLLEEERSRGIPIKHAGNGSEVKILGRKVDGYYEAGKTIFEFHGCFCHGCVKCFRDGRDKPIHNNSEETMNTRFE